MSHTRVDSVAVFAPLQDMGGRCCYDFAARCYA